MNDQFPWIRVIAVSVIAIVPLYFLSAIVLLIAAGNLDVAYALGISDVTANAIPIASGSLLVGILVARVSGVRGWWIAFTALCGLSAGLAMFYAFVSMGFAPGGISGIASWAGELIAIIGATWFGYRRTHLDMKIAPDLKEPPAF